MGKEDEWIEMMNQRSQQQVSSLGKSEEEQNEITIRKHNGETLGQMPVEDFCALLNKEVRSKK